MPAESPHQILANSVNKITSKYKIYHVVLFKPHTYEPQYFTAVYTVYYIALGKHNSFRF